MKTSASFTESLFAYEWDEYQRWCDGDVTTIQGLIGRCGPLGRAKTTYSNQASRKKGSQNYPEVRYAVHLVESDEFPEDSIVYENFTLSLAVLQESGARLGLRATGAKLVGQVFSEEFLRTFDRLYDLNKSKIKKSRAGMLVDLLAVDPPGRRVLLAEVKKYGRRAKATEPVQKDQLLVLGFVRHAVDKLGPKAFVGEPFDVRTTLVAFADSVDLRLHRIEPKAYSVDFVV